MQDLIIIGAGPAGLTASVYASRYGIRHLVIGEIPGGLMMQTNDIGNWPGIEAVSGADLTRSMADHAKSYGVEILPIAVKKILRQDDGTFVVMADEKEYPTRTIIVATGTAHRHLGVPGEKELAGKGVSSCPTCDGFFFRGKTVAVVGGGDSAAVGALHLSHICERVFVIVRDVAMNAEKFWQDALASKENVIMLSETKVQEIRGEEKVNSLLLDRPYQGSESLAIDGIFIEIGLIPNTGLLSDLGATLDRSGSVEVAPDQGTGVPGLFAAGDITTNSNGFRQIVTAASEGAIAANTANEYLQKIARP